MSKLIKSFALVSAFSFITRGIGFVARIILTRNLLTYDLGLYQSALSLFHVFLALATSGLPLAVSRFFANGKIKGTLSSALLLAIILSAIGISLPIVFRSTFLKVFSDPISLNLFYYLLPVLPLTAVYSLLRGALLGKEMFFHYSFTELFDELIYFVSLFVLFLIFKDSPVAIYVPCISMIVSTLLPSILCIILTLKNERLSLPQKDVLSQLLKITLPITSTRVLSSAISAFTTLILPALYIRYGLSQKQALSTIGLFSGVISPLVFVSLSVIGPLCLVLLPDMAKKHSDSKSRLLHSFLFISLLSAVILAFYLTYGEEILLEIFLKKEGGEILCLCSFAILPMGLNQLCSSTLNAMGMERTGLINYIISSTFGILIIILLTPKISVFAQVLSLLIQPIIALLLNLIKLCKSLKISLKELAKSLLPYLFFLPLTIISLSVKFLPFDFPSLIQIFISFVLLSLITLAFSYVLLPKTSLKLLKRKAN